MDVDKQQKRSRNDTRQQQPQPARAAWNIPAWCAALGLGRSTFYILDIRPRSIKIGKRTLITEPPGEYAERIAAMQAAGGAK